ncbi:diacylglycerol kinase family protein [uncultured Sunxiuqinia sp.]|uniref:diacylglycerol/lipid kinase family protein n=1 Tax=uncultured Sunxiuqinia sp. TaxID=1573825 RepID=UPI002637BC3B|nr:diacylglycerol kinase family protein [uncultured Sunxiuqinia sp.]
MSRNEPNILVIVNPNAGKRKTRQLRRKLEARQENITVRQTTYPRHSVQIIQEEFDRHDVFVAVGGDGTVNEMATALLGSDKKLAVYPAGSGNGFAREFGFNKNLNKLMATIASGKSLTADAMLINGQVSMHVSGVGYDGEVAHDFAKLPGRGFWNYLFSTIRVFWQYNPIQASIELENETINGRFFMINLANTAQFGYGARIASQANPTDGLLELVLVRPMALWAFVLFSSRLFLGTLKSSEHLSYRSTAGPITLKTSARQFHRDGDPILLESPVKIEISTQKIKVVDTGNTKFCNNSKSSEKSV